MITGVLLVLAGESLFFGSWPLVGWLAAFFVIHAIYLLRIEEPGLERRYGEEYQAYRANVPRWFPRVRPWVAT
jgi:protein-S-isoprenylcysteine O-methyltransferase Ste14